ncbi:MAG: ATP-binding protein [Verrucomicrobia bacterium]|nr:ATP-binding protein [Verrucomicrobiota bacterium]
MKARSRSTRAVLFCSMITVSDNGTGIPVELREKLFSPSFTTKTSGMGLGLAIVKNMAENFAGKVWFETELDEGKPGVSAFCSNH